MNQENLDGVGMRFQIISYWMYADGVDEKDTPRKL